MLRAALGSDTQSFPTVPGYAEEPPRWVGQRAVAAPQRPDRGEEFAFVDQSGRSPWFKRGLIIAAINPTASVAWVRAGILYGIVVLIFEIISQLHGKGFHLGPVIFGLAFTLLLVATYPERKKLLPSVGGTPPKEAEAQAPAPAAEAEEKA